MSTRVYLAIDNCFASKRWCEPAEWMRVVRDLGLRYVGASADNEIDPLYSCPAYLNDWLRQVRKESERTGVRVVNCYSGHGTYSTLGLGHGDPRVRRHLERDWVAPMLRLAGRLDAGLGFFAHAFPESVLRERSAYDEAYGQLVAAFQRLSVEAEESGARTLGVEQMYTPHQVPWTLAGAADFLRRCNAKKAGLPVYLTLDTGHQVGQRSFPVPAAKAVDRFAAAARAGKPDPLYLGPRECAEHFRRLAQDGMSGRTFRMAVAAFVVENEHLFALDEDGDPYRWLAEFAAFSPIIHLQQTDGKHSRHWCFTKTLNAAGVISAPRVLQAIAASVRRKVPTGFPPRVKEIYLTLEPFLGTAAHSRVVLDDIAESVRCWRRYVPEDGMTIESAVAGLKK